MAVPFPGGNPFLRARMTPTERAEADAANFDRMVQDQGTLVSMNTVPPLEIPIFQQTNLGRRGEVAAPQLMPQTPASPWTFLCSRLWETRLSIGGNAGWSFQYKGAWYNVDRVEAEAQANVTLYLYLYCSPSQRPYKGRPGM